MKNLKIVLCALFVLGLVLPVTKTHAATKAYDYDLVYQSSIPLTMQPGETANVYIEVKNTGTNTWWDYQDPAYAYHPVRLGAGSYYSTLPNQQKDQPSEFANADWISPDRAADTSPNVTRPGWNTRFQFNIKAPTTPGTYKAYFTPVVEGIGWMKDIGIYWDINVGGGQVNQQQDSLNNSPTFDTSKLDISQNGLYIAAEKEFVLSGQSTNLNWGLSPLAQILLTSDQLSVVKKYLNDNVACSIDNSIGNVDAEGQKLITNITTNQTYNLTCTDSKTGKVFQSSVADGTSAQINIVSMIPPKVTGVTSTKQSNGDILLQWDDMGTNVESYSVNLSEYPNFSAPQGTIAINTHAVTTNSLILKQNDLKPNTKYYVEVQSYSKVGSYENVPSQVQDFTATFTTENYAQPTVQTPTTTGTYNYDIVSQSTYPSSLNPGQVTNVSIDIKNTGTATWNKTGDNPVRLGTGSQFGNNQPRDYTSEFANTDWLSSNRPVAIDKSIINPGETAHFQFNIKAPATPGMYKAYFTPVVDGVDWMKDTGIYWAINVAGQSTAQTATLRVIADKVIASNFSISGPKNYSGQLTSRLADVSQVAPILDSSAPVGDYIFTCPASTGYTVMATSSKGSIGNGSVSSQINAGDDVVFKCSYSISPSSLSTPPAVPTGLKVFSTANTAAFLSWDSVSGATQYELYRSNQSNGTYSLIYTGSYTSYSDLGLATNATYYYKVLARNNNGASVMSSSVSATLNSTASTTPTATVPLNLSINQCMTTVFCISWGSPVLNGNNATDQLYRSTNATSGFSLIFSGTGGGYQDSNVVAGTTYYYKVRSSFDGSTFSDYTPVVSGHILAPGEYPAPAAPTLTLSNLTSTQVTLNWTNTSPSYYELYYDPSSNGSFSNKIYSGIAQTYTHTGLTPGSNYYYKVRAVGVNGLFSNSSVISATTTTQTVVPVPTNLRKTQEAPGSITMAWDAVTGASTYELYNSTSASGIFAWIYTGINTSTTLNLSSSATYYYKVRAKNSAGVYSDFSSIVPASASTPYVSVSVPLNFRVTGTTSSSVSIAWNSATNATTYELYRNLGLGYDTSNELMIYSGSNTSFIDTTGILPSTRYSYKVVAKNGSYYSNYSPYIYGTTLLLKGDLNNDGIINQVDYDTMTRMFNGTIPATAAADIDGDGIPAQIGDLVAMIDIVKKALGTSVIKGDLNSDGLINQTDLTILSNMSIGALTPDLARGDMNSDGVILSNDVLILSRMIQGAIVKGDVTGDGIVTTADVNNITAFANKYSSLSDQRNDSNYSFMVSAADVANNQGQRVPDGYITIDDALVIWTYYAQDNPNRIML